MLEEWKELAKKEDEMLIEFSTGVSHLWKMDELIVEIELFLEKLPGEITSFNETSTETKPFVLEISKVRKQAIMGLAILQELRNTADSTKIKMLIGTWQLRDKVIS